VTIDNRISNETARSAERADHQTIRLTLKVWRQRDARDKGRFVTYVAPHVSPHMSFLEMLDVVNEELIEKGEDPIVFDHDCREGICGSCGFMINGVAHGQERATTVCQLHMRHFKDGDTLTIEPWRARAFPVIKDLMVDRTALDRIVESGGYVSVNTGGAPDANAIPVPKPDADRAFEAAQCIQCGACVAACPNASAMLFLAAKQSHLGLLPQGQPERYTRTVRMVNEHDRQGFGACTNMKECEAVCPKEIGLDYIARLNRDLIRAKITGKTA
jgi:succinate dehydrogenase / fumarate reductase, iron-sulfur subunit